MAAFLDCVQQVLMQRVLDAWPDLPRASREHTHAPITEWHSRLDVAEARLAERRMQRLDAEAALPEREPPDGLDHDA